jgi:predicted ATPase
VPRRPRQPAATELFLKRVRLDEPTDGALPDAYPFDLPAVRHLGERSFRAPVTVFVGENGMGKSTLLEALAVAVRLNPEGGSRNLRFATKETHSELHRLLRVTRAPRPPRDAYFLRAESFYNVATQIDALDAHADHSTTTAPPILDSYGKRSLHAQSHGESFFTLFLQRLGGRGLYLLDEPEAALSPQRQLALLGHTFADPDGLLRCGPLVVRRSRDLAHRGAGHGALADHEAVSRRSRRHAARTTGVRTGGGRAARPGALDLRLRVRPADAGSAPSSLAASEAGAGKWPPPQRVGQLLPRARRGTRQRRR